MTHGRANHLRVDDACTAGASGAQARACFRESFDKETNQVGYTGFIAVGVGGALGCWLRWTLGILLNPIFPTLPLGTLSANLLGGMLMGIVLGIFDHFQTLPPELRLFLATGFLGGLTTFSTFSAESTTLLLRQQYLWFGGHVVVHLVGSIAMTVSGIALTRMLLRS
jgi:CrcB protein